MADSSLPEVLAQHPPLLKAAQAALRQIKTSASTDAGRSGVVREADKLRQAIARARVIARKRGRRVY